MLSHRTGITRHDLIWYKSDFSQKDLFERLRYGSGSRNSPTSSMSSAWRTDARLS
jgi:hypothetical protein